jgi:hypothetical protein
VWEEELMRREEVLTLQEKEAKTSKGAIVKVSADLDAEWAKAEATWKDYLHKMEAHATHARHSLGLDKMLGEKKVELNGREQDLDLREATLVEARSWGLNHWHNRKELMEFIKLWRCHKEADVKLVTEDGWLVILVKDVSKVLVDLGMSPIHGIPRDPCTTGDVLQVVGTIFEHLREAYSSSHGPWD